MRLPSDQIAEIAEIAEIASFFFSPTLTSPFLTKTLIKCKVKTWN